MGQNMYEWQPLTGRELDIYIAHKLGWTWIESFLNWVDDRESGYSEWNDWRGTSPEYKSQMYIPCFSTNLTRAWQLPLPPDHSFILVRVPLMGFIQPFNSARIARWKDELYNQSAPILEPALAICRVWLEFKEHEK